MTQHPILKALSVWMISIPWLAAQAAGLWTISSWATLAGWVAFTTLVLATLPWLVKTGRTSYSPNYQPAVWAGRFTLWTLYTLLYTVITTLGTYFAIPYAPLWALLVVVQGIIAYANQSSQDDTLWPLWGITAGFFVLAVILSFINVLSNNTFYTLPYTFQATEWALYLSVAIGINTLLISNSVQENKTWIWISLWPGTQMGISLLYPLYTPSFTWFFGAAGIVFALFHFTWKTPWLLAYLADHTRKRLTQEMLDNHLAWLYNNCFNDENKACIRESGLRISVRKPSNWLETQSFYLQTIEGTYLNKPDGWRIAAEKATEAIEHYTCDDHLESRINKPDSAHDYLILAEKGKQLIP